MIRFLKSFLTLFSVFIGTDLKNQRKLDVLSKDEIVTRFVMSSGYYRKGACTVRHQAFLPEVHPENNTHETSVFRISTLTDAEAWDLGEKEVSKGKKTILCRANLKVEDIEQIDPLTVIPEKTTHDLHAIVINWPAAKDEQKLLAMELERIAKTVPAP